MTIEEAIEHAKEVAEKCEGGDRQCAYQHDKLADWLEELKAYKETGVMPEEIKEVQEALAPIQFGRFHDIMEAERAGRLILLPCKVTDTVYMIESCLGGENCVGKRKKKFPLTDRVVSAQIDHITIGGTTGKPVYDLCTETGSWFMSLEPGEFYLTREAAEKALEEGRKNSEAD